MLTPAEVDGLFVALRAMAAQGFGIIFISHKLNEVRALTHRCVVLRHGRVAGEVADPDATTAAEMARLMCGHEITRAGPRRARSSATLRWRSTTSRPRAIPARRSRRSALPCAAARSSASPACPATAKGAGRRHIGHDRAERGQHRRARRAGHSASAPNAMMALGVGRIPEDRMTEGLVTALPLADCMVLPRIGNPAFSRAGLLKPGAIIAFAEEQIQRLRHTLLRARWRGPARCLAAICRRRCWRASSPSTRPW